MIRSEFTATHLDPEEREIGRHNLDQMGDDPAEDLPQAIVHLLTGPARPAFGESVRLTMPGLPMHVTLGVATHRIRPRTRRRILDRLWPEDAPPPVWYEKAAFLLIQHGTCVIRHALTGSLVASLN